MSDPSLSMKSNDLSFYSRATSAPTASSTFFIFSASSLVTFSRMTLGADSAIFLASTKLAPGSKFFNSRITLALTAASNLINLIANSVFSTGFSYLKYFHSLLFKKEPTVFSSAAGAAGPAPAVAPGIMTGASWMLSRVYVEACWFLQVWNNYTLSSLTSCDVSNSDNRDMVSTRAWTCGEVVSFKGAEEGGWSGAFSAAAAVAMLRLIEELWRSKMN